MFWLSLLVPISALVTASYLTDPFNRFTIVKLPFRFRLLKHTHEIHDHNQQLVVRQNLLYRLFAVAKAGLHIIHTRYIDSPRSTSQSVDGIIADIHDRRFDPSKLLVISGDHFNSLFVRNLGVFYYPLLDATSESTAADWQRRQESYLQTVAYALGVFAKRPVPVTTIVPTGRLAATCINFYAYPSDTVYSLLFALAALMGKQAVSPVALRQNHHLQTKLAAGYLTSTYHQTLIQLYQHYSQTVFDPTTGLIRTNLHLSGAKDITRRTGAFYDNIIYWKTTQLAQTLGLVPRNQAFLDDLKQAIIERFWLEKEGYFLEDLSDIGVDQKFYSSDWLVVLFTGFLDITNPAERVYYEHSIAYLQTHRIDQPFGLKYQQDRRSARQFLPVRLAVASYGGDTIWSFWGMEYIKALCLLYRETGDTAYQQVAKAQLEHYEAKMIEYGGFPELYDNGGRMLKAPLYRSIRQTGWVVGFEQARAIYRELCAS
jgi:hypothetical protein